MTFTMNSKASIALATLALTACTGETSDSETVFTPLAQTGFATPSDEIASSINFRSLSDGRIVVSNSSGDAQTVPVSVRFVSGETQDGQTSDLARMVVTVDGDTRTLFRQNPTSDSYVRFTGNALETDARFTTERTADGVGGTVVQSGLLEFDNPEDPSNSSGYIVFGFDTDPAFIATETGSVDYDGGIDVVGYSDGVYANAEGTITVSVNFDDPRSVTGSLNHGAIENMLDAQTYLLLDGAIDANGVTASLSPRDAFQPDETFDGGTLEGTFFGAGAEAIGGTVSFSVSEIGDDEVLVQGGFIAER